MSHGPSPLKWLVKTLHKEERALERARRRFVRKPTEQRLHDVRTTGRRLRSLLEDVAELIDHAKLLKRVKRVAAATDAARDATIIRRLLESSVVSAERESAEPLLERLREEERVATRSACRHLRRARFTD
jgi:CHAD domain-containing protein